MNAIVTRHVWIVTHYAWARPDAEVGSASTSTSGFQSLRQSTVNCAFLDRSTLIPECPAPRRQPSASKSGVGKGWGTTEWEEEEE